MKNEVNIITSNTEMVTISRAEYESLKAERDELNQKLDWLMEQMEQGKVVDPKIFMGLYFLSRSVNGMGLEE